MKASKFSDAQKAFILKQGADGVPVADICRKAGFEPPPVCRRPFGLSYAAMAGWSSMA